MSCMGKDIGKNALYGIGGGALLGRGSGNMMSYMLIGGLFGSVFGSAKCLSSEMLTGGSFEEEQKEKNNEDENIEDNTSEKKDPLSEEDTDSSQVVTDEYEEKMQQAEEKLSHNVPDDLNKKFFNRKPVESKMYEGQNSQDSLNEQFKGTYIDTNRLANFKIRQEEIYANLDGNPSNMQSSAIKKAYDKEKTNDDYLNIISMDTNRTGYTHGSYQASVGGSKYPFPNDDVLIYDPKGDLMKSGRSVLKRENIEIDLEKLKTFDTNGDKIIDSKDPEFQHLKLWNNKNRNSIIDNGELKPLKKRFKINDIDDRIYTFSDGSTSILIFGAHATAVKSKKITHLKNFYKPFARKRIKLHYHEMTPDEIQQSYVTRVTKKMDKIISNSWTALANYTKREDLRELRVKYLKKSSYNASARKDPSDMNINYITFNDGFFKKLPKSKNSSIIKNKFNHELGHLYYKHNTGQEFTDMAREGTIMFSAISSRSMRRLHETQADRFAVDFAVNIQHEDPQKVINEGFIKDREIAHPLFLSKLPLYRREHPLDDIRIYEAVNVLMPNRPFKPTLKPERYSNISLTNIEKKLINKTLRFKKIIDQFPGVKSINAQRRYTKVDYNNQYVELFNNKENESNTYLLPSSLLTTIRKFMNNAYKNNEKMRYSAGNFLIGESNYMIFDNNGHTIEEDIRMTPTKIKKLSSDNTHNLMLPPKRRK